MKLFLLPVLSWALAISPTYAQKQLPASLQPYAVNWGYSTKQMLNAAGYEVPGPKANYDLLPAADHRSAKLELDSTITYFGYVSQGQDSTPLFRNVYTYPQSGVTVTTEYFYDKDHWTPLSMTTLIADDFGRLVDMVSQLYETESGVFIPDSRIELFPHENSLVLVDSFYVSSWNRDDNIYKRLFSVKNTYDEQNRLYESLSIIETFQVPLLFLDRYNYNAAGNLKLIESFNIDGDEEIPSSRQEFAYAGHLVDFVITLISDGAGGFFPQNKLIYSYTGFNKQKRLQYFEFDFEKNEFKLNEVDSFGYDANERVVLKEINTLNTEDSWVRHRDSYTFVQDDYIGSETGFVYEENLNAWTVEDKKFYYYTEVTADEPVEPGVADAMFLYPNPSSGKVQVKLAGDITVYVYSLSGQLIRRIPLSPGEKIVDLSHLPAGLYQVRAKSGEDYFSGKLILQ
jgi:hypothetical protein